mgnify:CR=1 FL=1
MCDAGDTEIWGLHFVGNRTFEDAVLAANAFLTEPSGALRRWFRVFGDKRCLDKLELSRDSLRLIVFYRRHGFTAEGDEFIEAGITHRSMWRDV